VYSVVCSLLPSAATNSKYSDVFISTTPGGTYHAVLFHGHSPTQQDLILQKLNALTLDMQIQADATSRILSASNTQLSQHISEERLQRDQTKSFATREASRAREMAIGFARDGINGVTSGLTAKINDIKSHFGSHSVSTRNCDWVWSGSSEDGEGLIFLDRTNTVDCPSKKVMIDLEFQNTGYFNDAWHYRRGLLCCELCTEI
jgi:hypothetical protein